MDTGTAIVFVAVVGARFLVPLLIPFFPLPAILASLVLDGVDQTIFQAFGHDPPQYQGYDKAMDVYYLAVAYLSTMRNWTSRPAVQVARFLYFYRLVGVVAFELADWRPLLLIFPNTFEYFFIAYEVIRLRWDPARIRLRTWIIIAATIWIVVKLPQEWWIHVAKLDVTDLMAEHGWILPTLLAVLALAAALFYFLVVPRLPAPAWPWRFAADPLPENIDEAAERDRWVAANSRLWSTGTLEKVVLMGLLWVIYAEVLPEGQAGTTQLFLGVAVFVVINAAISLFIARRTRSFESALAAFAVRALINVGLILVASWLVGGTLQRGNAIFFVLLLSLITLLDDRFRPVHEARFAPSVVGRSAGEYSS
ncbi:hypothetical protein [Actinoplanes solisilvae]|uniref:hypothetical protein n=1 Tax=Actinoplanes solisilvae TaxID=2486853 RepID=UPI000FD8062D|nr:hypothetical protein [Actinoplanes solisilvae]